MALLAALAALPYLVLLAWTYRNLLKAKPFTASTQTGTFVTVIVPCRNEEENIAVLLGDLAAQDYPADGYEVIVVDDNSEDNTPSIAALFSSEREIRLIRSEGSGKKAAIRTAVLKSSGDLIVTTDADCRLGRHWLKTIASSYMQGKPSMIICPVSISSSGSIGGIFQEMEFLALQGVTAGTAMGRNAVMCNGANLAFERNAYIENLENLRFDIPGGDDIFLLHALKKDRNREIRWLESAEALAETSGMKSIPLLLRQRSRWISKSPYYRDPFSIAAGIVTFVTLLIQAGLYIAGNLDTSLIYAAILFTGIKSLPDILLIINRAHRYRKKLHAGWFLPFQLLYPLYVIAVVLRSWIPAGSDR